MNVRFLVFTFGIACGISVFGGERIGISERILLTDTLYSNMMAGVLSAPVFAQFRQPVSLSLVSVGYGRQSLDNAVLYADGTGSASAYFDASAYIKSKNATITGSARYDNGKRFGVRYCETSDPAIVYPYFTADAVGGDMTGETYMFGGSYSSSIHDRWHYGVSLSYRAVQEYRSIDPRPKNTIGRLEASVGVGYATTRYVFGLSFEAFKYRQSNSIMFVSELGELPVYHLLGLGRHYARFAGTGKDSRYDGWNRSLSLAMYPLTRGVFASLDIGLFSFDKILCDMNNLPLNSLTRKVAELSVGWKSDDWIVEGNAEWQRRRGLENVFGEPTGNVYPELFSLATFKSEKFSCGVEGLWRHTVKNEGRVDTKLSVAYFDYREYYYGTEPFLKRDTEVVSCAVVAGYVHTLGKRWILAGNVNGGFDKACDWLSGYYIRTGLKAGVDYIINARYALGIQASGSLCRYADNNEGYAFKVQINFKF